MKLELTEQEVNELLTELAEAPAKYSYNLIAKIQNKFKEQNQPEAKNDSPE